MRVLTVVAAGLALSGGVWGQTRLVRASGNSTLSAKPDQVTLNVGVVTTADTAQAAAAQNASQMDAVLGRLKQALGSAGETRTIAYSISPNYRSTNGQPVLTGFTASNTVQVISSDLGSIGAVIDAASQAGANSIGGLSFTVKSDQVLRSQALSAAAKEARSHAEAIAAGLGGRLGSVITAQEGGSVTPVVMDTRAAATATPIEPGLVQISATVTVEIELL